MPDAHRSGPGLHCPPSPGKATHTPSALHVVSGEHRRLGAHMPPGSCRAAHTEYLESQKSGGAHRLTAQLPPSWTSVVGFRHFDWSHTIPSSQTTTSPSHDWLSSTTLMATQCPTRQSAPSMHLFSEPGMSTQASPGASRAWQTPLLSSVAAFGSQ
jgi:hypothetical protein